VRESCWWPAAAPGAHRASRRTRRSRSLLLCAPVPAVLRLGHEAAGALGERVERAPAAAPTIAVLLVGPVVALCGPVAWVGLLAPHLGGTPVTVAAGHSRPRSAWALTRPTTYRDAGLGSR